MTEAPFNLEGAEKRRVLWIVLTLNAALAAGLFAAGVFSDSSALIANGLDNASDAAVYALSLLALGRAPAWKRAAARAAGIMLLIFAAGVLVEAGRRYFFGSEPVGSTMMAMALIAAVVNLICLMLLKGLKHKDVNLRAATTFSLNDFMSNGGILAGGALVLWTGQNWPDLVVAVGVAGVALFGAVEILKDAHDEADGVDSSR